MRSASRLLIHVAAFACAAALQLLSRIPVAHAGVAAVCDSTRDTTGLGDRFLDFISACTYARLASADVEAVRSTTGAAEATLVSLWRAGRAGMDVSRSYDASTFVTPEGCSFFPAARFPKWTLGGLLGPQCVEHIHLGDVNGTAGRFTPERITTVLRQRHPEVASRVSVGNATAAFVATAAELRIAPEFAPLTHADALRNATCVHLRRGDKVNDALALQGSPCYFTAARWDGMRDRAMNESRLLLSLGQRTFYVLSDEEQYRRAFVEELEAAGAEVLNEQLSDAPERPIGLKSVVEFFRLASCRRILEVVPYSSFATAAALVGSGRGLELVLFGGWNESHPVPASDRPCDYEKFRSIARIRIIDGSAAAAAAEEAGAGEHGAWGREGEKEMGEAADERGGATDTEGGGAPAGRGLEPQRPPSARDPRPAPHHQHHSLHASAPPGIMVSQESGGSKNGNVSSGIGVDEQRGSRQQGVVAAAADGGNHERR